MNLTLDDEISLVALINDPTLTQRRWDRRAACASLRRVGDPYFPDPDACPPREALACCARCPVSAECLATALVHEANDGLRFGWWGGLDPDQRDLIAVEVGLSALPLADDELTPADLARHLRAQRLTIPSIAAELGCTERTVYRYLAAAA